MMNFQRRFRLLSLTLAPITLLYAIYFILLNQWVYPHYNVFSARTLIKSRYNREAIPKIVDYLIIGDSSALYSLNPKEISPLSFSASNLAASVYSSYKTLKSLNQIVITRGIIIGQTFTQKHYQEDLWEIMVPTNQLHLSEIVDMFCLHSTRSCSFNQKLFLTTKYYFSKFYLTSHSFNEFIEFLKTFLESDNEKKIHYFEEFITKNNGHYASPSSSLTNHQELISSWGKSFKKNINGTPSSELFYLSKVIEYAKEHHVALYFIGAPLAPLPELAQSYPVYRQQVSEFLSKINLQGLKFISPDETNYHMNINDFVDINHLHQDSAKKFTKIVVKSLNEHQ